MNKMIKCPKCHAEIEENANFCLYCMTSFEEKEVIEFKNDNKRWILYLVSALLVFSIIISAIIIFGKNDRPTNSSSGASSETSTSLNDSSNTETSDNESGDDSSGKEQSVSSFDGSSADGNTNGGSSSSGKNSSNGTPQNLTGSSGGTSGTDTTGSTDGTSSTDDDTTSDNTTPITPVFEYITGTNENVYPAGEGMLYQLENIIVITKVKYTEPSGSYVIPETIDGKKVGAIMPSAFSEISNNVKSVTLPSTVRTIWNDAFKDCYNLKDLYIKSSVICIEAGAFPEKEKRNYTLTIHCKKDCRNFDYYYYRNIAENYDANYQEWNG